MSVLRYRVKTSKRYRGRWIACKLVDGVVVASSAYYFGSWGAAMAHVNDELAK